MIEKVANGIKHSPLDWTQWILKLIGRLPWIFLFSACVAMIAYALTLLLPSEYSSTAKILPPSIFSSPARLPIYTGESLQERLSEQLSIRYQTDMALTVLKSTPVMDNLIASENLAKRLGLDDMQALRDSVNKMARFSSNRDGVIFLTIYDIDSKRAADISNAYVKALDRFMIDFTAAAAVKRAAAIEQQLLAAQKKLAEAEKRFAISQSKTGILRADGQTSSQINNLADLRQRLAVRESQLSAMSAYSTSINPGYQRVLAEIQGLRLQIDKIVGYSQPRSEELSNIGKSDDEREYQRVRREAKSYEDIVDGLTRQLAQAQFDAIGKVSSLQIIENATPADRPSGPARLLIAAISGIAGLFLCLLVMLFIFVFARWRHAQALAKQNEQA